MAISGKKIRRVGAAPNVSNHSPGEVIAVAASIVQAGSKLTRRTSVQDPSASKELISKAGSAGTKRGKKRQVNGSLTGPTVSEEEISAYAYRDHTMAAVHEAMEGLVALGLAEPASMQEFDEACLIEAPNYDAAKLKKLRARENVTQAVLAHYIGVSVNAVSQWERGERKAGGAAAKLLSLVEKHGLTYIR